MLLDDLSGKLAVDGVGVLNTSIFTGSAANLPEGDGPFLVLIETGGMQGIRVQNQTAMRLRQPMVQIVTVGKSYAATLQMALAAFVSLDGVFNAVLGTTFYQRIVARQEPTDTGLDNVKRSRFSFNVEITKNP